MEQKTWKMEITEGETEKTIENVEFRGLKPEEISSKIYAIFEKIQQDRLEFANKEKEDIFVIKDYISIVNNLSVDSGGPHELKFNLELEGLVAELKDKYESALKDQIEKLNLESDQSYAIYNWDHKFRIYDKSEEVINDDTTFKVVGHEGNLIEDGKAYR